MKPKAPETQVAPIDTLRPQRKNANRHTSRGMGELADSIQRVGWLGAMTVAADGETFDGSARLEVAGEKGFDDYILVKSDGKIPVVVMRTDIPTADDPRAVLAGLAANRVQELNLDFDFDLLAELDRDGFDFHGLWNEDELPDFPVNNLLVDADPDHMPENVETRVKRGDLWCLGEHRLLCGDSLSQVDVERLMSGKTPNMVWSDPPYGINIVSTSGVLAGRESANSLTLTPANPQRGWVGGGEAYNIPFGGVKKAKGDVGGGAAHMRRTGKPYIAKDAPIRGTVGAAKPFGSEPQRRGSDGTSNMIEVGKYAPVIGDDTTETAAISSALLLALFPKAVHIWWGGNHYSDKVPQSSCWLVWDKENTGDFADAELAWTNQPTAVRLFRHMWNGLMKASERGVRRVHPTQKPVALAEWAFNLYGKHGDVVLDPFLGSGMSIIAAEQTGRTVYGCEMSEEYCDIIIARWEQAVGKTAVKEGENGAVH